jgi:hypothetical protein
MEKTHVIVVDGKGDFHNVFAAKPTQLTMLTITS